MSNDSCRRTTDCRRSPTWYGDVRFDTLFSSPSRQRYDLLGRLCMQFTTALPVRPISGPREYLAADARILALIHDISRYLLSRQAHPLVHSVRWHPSTVVGYLGCETHLLFRLSDNYDRDGSAWFESATDITRGRADGECDRYFCASWSTKRDI